MNTPPLNPMPAIDALHITFASHITEPWTSGEVILDVSSGSRGLQATYVTLAGERRGFDDLDVFDAPCEGVIAALELERPDVETTTRFAFAPDTTPSYETTIVEPDDDAQRHARWRTALSGAIAALNGGTPPDGYGTLISFRLGGPDPLEFIATVRRERPTPHWLFVTNGFSEPRADDAADGPSGYGFEISIRVPRLADDPAGDAPSDFVVLLQTLARYVFSTGSIFTDGDYTMLPAGVAGLGGLAGLAFVADPELTPIETRNGTIAFRSAVGLTLDEITAIQAWTTSGFIDLALEERKLAANLITVPGRASFLTDPAFRARVTEGGARDGSRTGSLFLPELTLMRKSRLLREPSVVVRLDEQGLFQTLAVLPNRIRFERALTLIGQQHRLKFKPASAVTLEGTDDEIAIGLTAQAALDLVRAFDTGAKRYSFPAIPLSLELA